MNVPDWEALAPIERTLAFHKIIIIIHSTPFHRIAILVRTLSDYLIINRTEWCVVGCSSYVESIAHQWQSALSYRLPKRKFDFENKRGHSKRNSIQLAHS